MKKIYSLFVISAILVSCGKNKETSVESIISSGNLKELTAKKKEITSKLEEINKNLEAINTAISEKDTVKKLPLITNICSKRHSF